MVFDHFQTGSTSKSALPPLPLLLPSVALCCHVLRLVVVTMSYGGTSGYRLASNIERATGRTVRGVVMWDFLTSFGRGIQGGPLVVGSAREVPRACLVMFGSRNK